MQIVDPDREEEARAHALVSVTVDDQGRLLGTSTFGVWTDRVGLLLCPTPQSRFGFLLKARARFQHAIYVLSKENLGTAAACPCSLSMQPVHCAAVVVGQGQAGGAAVPAH